MKKRILIIFICLFTFCVQLRANNTLFWVLNVFAGQVTALTIATIAKIKCIVVDNCTDNKTIKIIKEVKKK